MKGEVQETTHDGSQLSTLRDGWGESLIIHWGRIYMQMSKSGDRTSEAHAGHMSLRCLWSAKNRR